MTTINALTSQTPFNVATVNALGGVQLATGGGHIAAVPVVTAAGSSDCVATLYDGTSTSGQPLNAFSLAAVGPGCMPNSSFGVGLFVDVIGTTAGTVQITYTGQAA